MLSRLLCMGGGTKERYDDYLDSGTCLFAHAYANIEVVPC
jgi:hypothetical protein